MSLCEKISNQRKKFELLAFSFPRRLTVGVGVMLHTVATTGVTLRRANFQLPPVKNFDDEFEIVDTIGKG